MREGGKLRAIDGLMYVIERNTRDFLDMGCSSNDAYTRTVQKWRKPEGEVLKINFDGVFAARIGEGG